jgi:glycosyltransferase involved in cell wall biosynthesis
MSRLLLVSSHFPPDRSAGTHRVVRFANYLQDHGWAVHVLTIDPASYRRSIPVDDALLGRVGSQLTIHRTGVFRGVSTLVQWRDRLMRTPPTAAATDGRRSARPASTGWLAWRRQIMSSVFAFPDDEIGWLPAAVACGVRTVRRERIDVILTSAPPVTCHLIGRALKAMSGIRWVADFRDPWSRAPWGKHGSARGHRWLEAQVIKSADAVLLNTPELSREFTEWYGPGVAHKLHVVANGYDADVLGPFAELPPPPAPPFVLTHAGNLYGNRDPLPLLEGLAECLRDGGVPKDGIRLNLVGKVAAQFDVDAAVARLGLTGVVMRTPAIVHEEALKTLAASHALIVIQPGTSLQVPAKLYECVGLRRPILALADEGGVARVARESGLGHVVSPADVPGIARAIRLLFQRHGTATWPDEHVIRQFDAHRQSEILGGIVSRLVQAPPALSPDYRALNVK